MRTRSIALFLSLLIAIAVLAQYGPKSVTIKAAAKKQPTVVFSHEKHATLIKTCDTCHHTQKGLNSDKETKVAACTTCHLDPKDAKTPSMREMSLTKNPFHMRCIACHKQQKKGPTVCTQCHKK